MKKATIKMTIREIRRELFETNKTVVIKKPGEEEKQFDNKQARDFFFREQNQDEIYETETDGNTLIVCKA